MQEKYIHKKDAKELVRAQHAWHEKNQYQWPNQKIAEEYRKKGEKAETENGTGSKTKDILKKELMEIYGLTELEAINLLNGYYLTDYVNKYERIRTLKPLHLKKSDTET